ncbi:ATP-binding protein [Ktedonobacter robiniae]|uniref:ATP-binding protein n=1 Tax=Ktedonobacter robiniae TaxID=2778365 RepID=A0ABQ3UT76_9CHLR|nr:ATP-binding protein [Ktedonobacter robiniae]GHO56029.1 hypothetical protein KSB_45040 [Ktedonobacter robiniae]
MTTDLSHRPFQDLDPTLFSHLLTEKAAEEIEKRLENSAPGNCLRISDLPIAVMRELAQRLYQSKGGSTYICFLIKDEETKEHPWQVKAAQLIALRNTEDKPLLVFIAPGLHTSAEDSFDVSTFTDLSFTNLGQILRKAVLAQLPAILQPQITKLLDRVTHFGGRLTDDQIVKFLLTIGQNGATVTAIGCSLYQLDLIPDRALFESEDSDNEYLEACIKRNVHARQILTDSSTTLLTRIYRLKLEPNSIQTKLYSFLKEYTLEKVTQWGKVIATDPAHQDLSFDLWPFAKSEPECLLYVNPLKLPVRQNGETPVKLFHPIKTKHLTVSWETEPEFKNINHLDHFRVEVVDSAGSVLFESGRVKVKKGASKRMSHAIKDVADVGLEEGLYFLRVRAYTMDGVLLNKEDRENDPEVRRNPHDPSSKRINETEEFLYIDDNSITIDPPETVRNQTVTSYQEAYLCALDRLLGSVGRGEMAIKIKGLKPEKASWAHVGGRGHAVEEIFNVRFGPNNSYSLPLSGVLADIERRTLTLEDPLGRWTLDLSEHNGPSPRIKGRRTTEREKIYIPPDFQEARRRLLYAISSMEQIDAEIAEQELSTPSAAGLLIATISLLPLADEIEQYFASYRNWLSRISKDLTSLSDMDRQSSLQSELLVALDIDVVQATIEHGMNSKVAIRLLAPTHPLRLWWHLQHQRLAEAWLGNAFEADNPRSLFSSAVINYLRQLTPRYLPQLLLDTADQFYLDNGSLTPFWQLYLPANIHDSRSIRSRLVSSLGIQTHMSSSSSIRVDELAKKLRHYLEQHPYVSTLKLNVFNPGDAHLIADALVELQKGRPDAKYPTQHLKYQIQLFSESGILDDIGGALEDLLSPNRQVSETQDEFTLTSRNLLFPKLRFARNQFSDFKENPERFAAHISLLLNVFPASVSLENALEKGRSSYLHGLIQEPVTWFNNKQGNLAWLHQLRPGQARELSAVPDASRQLADVLTQFAHLQSLLCTKSAQIPLRPTVCLTLDLDEKSLLYQVHTASDWVLIVDSNLGLEYFDSAPELDRPVFVLDFAPEYLEATGEHLMLTTQATDEVVNILGPVLERYGINEGESQELLFFRLLRSLSGPLTLRLLAAPKLADEVISLALARLFLEQYGLLGNRVVIPLDAHINLFHQDPGFSRRRSDLLMVEVEPEKRVMVFHLLEVKSRRYGAEHGLENEIEEQLTNTQRVLQDRFDPRRPLLEREVRTKELITLLDFYLKRALRYGLIESEIAEQMSDFFISLDQGYALQFVSRGLIFDLSSASLKETTNANVTFHFIGTEYISRMVQQGLRSLNFISMYVEQAESIPILSSQSFSAMQRDPSFNSIRSALTTTSFGARALSRGNGATSKDAPTNVPETKHLADPRISRKEEEPGLLSKPFEPSVEASVGESLTNSMAEKALALDPELSSSSAAAVNNDPAPASSAILEGQEPIIDVLVGDTRMTPQYGVLGSGGGRIIGLDLNGVNTISLFGVQGAGKSYTIGTVVEMATQYSPGVNRLPHPLATVIFHYHESQDYAPEFVSMVQPNNREEELQRLRVEFGAEAAALSDVLILTSADKVAARRREFPDVEVQPISFRSNELTVRDWLFLMNAVDNQSVYITQINKIMREYRNNLTIENVRKGIFTSRLNDAQKDLAEMRLDFAAEYISDTATPLADHLKAGRLIIVDLRDELIRKDQALGLFVVMLTIFAGVGTHDENHLNKLIVFDEAHKYMTGSELTNQVVSVIRQMRHQGVSVLIASQDPLSLPGTVIELSSIILLHRFNSPSWLKHIQKSVVALNELTSGQLALLKPGEAYIWANKATEPLFSQKAVKIRLRPRVTLHGGATKTAGDL